MSKLVYIAGPYRGEVGANVQRAVRLAQHAIDRGLIPVVPHVHGYLGCFGDPSGNDPGTEEVVMRWCLGMVRIVAQTGGSIWAIEHDDGTLSTGTAAEVEAFTVECRRTREPALVLCQPWDRWSAEMGL